MGDLKMPDIKKKRSWIMWAVCELGTPRHLYNVEAFAKIAVRKSIYKKVKKVKVTEL